MQHNSCSIQVKEIKKTFINQNDIVQVFNGLSINFKANCFSCIVGLSGSGKSTLLNILANVTTLDQGQLIYKENDVNSKITKNLKIGFVFQNDRLLPWKNVFDNLDLILKTFEPSIQKRRETIRQFLNKVNLRSKSYAFPQDLSGGERQRVNLIRALIIDPDIIFMDEPFSHLDEITAETIRTEMLKIWEKKPITIIMVTHNILEAVYMADEIFVINKNKSGIISPIKVNIPRPRNTHFLTDFIFDTQAEKIINKVRNELDLN